MPGVMTVLMPPRGAVIITPFHCIVSSVNLVSMKTNDHIGGESNLLLGTIVVGSICHHFVMTELKFVVILLILKGADILFNF